MVTGPVWNPMAQQYEPKRLSLAEFLLQRIGEDEAVARAARPSVPLVHRDDAAGEAYLMRFGAARVLAECQAKRQIVELHQDGMADDRWEGDPDPLPGYCTRCHNRSEHQQEAWPCLTLRLLALPYADHRDYDEAWKP